MLWKYSLATHTRTLVGQQSNDYIFCILMLASRAGQTRQKLVVLGAGWGSYNVLNRIDHEKYEVIAISPRNRNQISSFPFLFSP